MTYLNFLKFFFIFLLVNNYLWAIDEGEITLDGLEEKGKEFRFWEGEDSLLGLERYRLKGDRVSWSYRRGKKLIKAIKERERDEIIKLLKKGVDFEAHDDYCEHKTSMYYTLGAGLWDLAEVLLELGAKVEYPGNDSWNTSWTYSSFGGPIFEAIKHKAPKDLIQTMLHHGDEKTLSRSGTPYGFTLLHMAAMYGRYDLIPLFVEKGADLQAVSRYVGYQYKEKLEDWLDYHSTALMLAARRGHQKTVKALLDAGAELSPRNKAQDTAYVLALKGNHFAVADIIEKDAKEKGIPREKY